MNNELIERIALDKIEPSPVNRRIGGFDQAKLEQLAESIKAVGVQQPAVVRAQYPKSPNTMYEIVAGERRWRASKIAGMDYLPCVVRELTDAQALHIQIVENLQREDVHPLDEADGYARLIEEGKYDVEHVARELGKSASYVYQRLKLRELVPKARELLTSGQISAGHGILIARLAEAQQEEILKEYLAPWRIKNNPPSVRELDGYIQSHILMELSKASWKVTDEDLVPAAGSCIACSKRTGFNPELFADVGKKDHCTDRACFAAKGQAMVERRKAELKDEKHIEVIDGYAHGREAPKGALQGYQWEECKKKDEGAMRVLVVDGDQPGRLTWGKTRGSRAAASVGPEAAAAAKAGRAKEKKLKAAQDSLLVEIYESILAQADLRILKRKESGEGLTLQRLVAFEAWRRIGWDAQRQIAKLEEWEKPESTMKGTSSYSWDPVVQELISRMDARKLDLFLVACTFGALTKTYNNSYFGIPEQLMDAAKILEIDLEAMIGVTLTETELKREELLPPRPSYMGDGDEDEAEEYNPAEDESEEAEE